MTHVVTQPANEVPHSFVPVWANNGELSSYMLKAVAYMRQRLADTEKKGEGWLDVMPQWMQSFYMMVEKQKWTLEQFFSTMTPAFAAYVWDAYMQSLPELERVQINSELYAFSVQAKREEKPEMTTDKPTTESTAPQLVNRFNRALTPKGQELTAWLERYVPDTSYGRGWIAFVLQTRMMTPGQYFVDFPHAGAQLWEAYQHFSPQMAVQEAQQHLDTASKLIDGLKKPDKPSASKASAQGSALQEAQPASDAIARAQQSLDSLTRLIESMADGE